MQFQQFARNRGEQILELNSCKQMPVSATEQVEIHLSFGVNCSAHRVKKHNGCHQKWTETSKVMEDTSISSSTQHFQMKPSVTIWEPKQKSANRAKLLVQKWNMGTEVWTLKQDIKQE